MTEYRTPREVQAQTEQDERIRQVLEQAVQDGASLFAAMELGEPPQVVERWVNAIWNGLRDNLSDVRPRAAGLVMEDRLAAIVMLLKERMNAEADVILRGLRGGEPDV